MRLDQPAPEQAFRLGYSGLWKLHIDFGAPSTNVCVMEESDFGVEPRELVGALLVRAGGLMEDESVEMVSRLPDDRCALQRRIARLAKISADLGALAAAAEALCRISAN